MSGKAEYIATVGWGSRLAKVPIVEGETYTEDDFYPGGLKDGLQGGVLRPVVEPEKPSPKRSRKTAKKK